MVDPREAYEKGEIIGELNMTLGDTDSTWNKCEYVFEGTVESGGQETFLF